MRIGELAWDDENIQHIARHGVNPEEVEDVCFGLHISEREKGQRYILSGQTGSGRYLTIVVERVSKALFRPITAFEMGEKYTRRYKERVRKRR